MHLTEVHVENFRNLDNFNASFFRGLNVIVGENNIGKTNLLDAIRLGLGTSATGEFLRLTREDQHRRATGDYVAGPIRVTLTFAGLSEPELAEFIEILNYNSADPGASTAIIRFEWSWPAEAKHWSVKRSGGGRTSEVSVPDEVLQAIPVTMLTALRDALVGLSPGRASRLAHLLTENATPIQREGVEKIVQDANNALQQDQLIVSCEQQIASTLSAAVGTTLSQGTAIRASETRFERIVANLRLVLKRGTDAAPVFDELRSNGLGYNNLLYIATVLAELHALSSASVPLLFVEEPEAHLHPQLQTLLADFLATGGTSPMNKDRVQTIVTTHSPTLAAHVDPEQISVMHRPDGGAIRCISVRSCGLSGSELQRLRRMLDVTKATLLFARGVILVEGVSEALLLPSLAARLSIHLHQSGVSVIPIAGVAFATIARLFSNDHIAIPVAIVTDADPGVDHDEDKKEVPKRDGNGFAVCDRTRLLVEKFSQNTQVRVFHSSVTLEYDLASAAAGNAEVIREAWESCYQRGGPELTKDALEAATELATKALWLWRALCRGNPSHGKAEVAQALAAALEERAEGSFKVPAFGVPKYLEDAMRHVLRQPSGGSS